MLTTIDKQNVKRCELCNREAELSRHHLIPKSEHNRLRKKYSKRFMNENIALLCRPCHSQIHLLFTEKHLARTLNTIEKIKLQGPIKKWLKFIRKKG